MRRKYVSLGRETNYEGSLYEASWRIQASTKNNCTQLDFLQEISRFLKDEKDDYIESDTSEDDREIIEEENDQSESPSE